MSDAATLTREASPHLAHPRKRRIAAFTIILVAEFFWSWCWNTVDVLRPQFRAELGLTLTEAGSAYSAQGLGALIGAVVSGQLADRIGKRAVLPPIMFGYGAITLAGLLVASYPELLAQRFLLGMLLGASYPVTVGIYVDLFQQQVRGKLAALMLAAYSLSLVGLGSAMTYVGGEWHKILLAGGLPPLLLALLIPILVPPIAPRPSADKPSGGLPVAELFAPTLRRRTVLLTLLCGLNFFAYQAFTGWMTTYLHEVRGLSESQAGDLFARQFIGYTIGAFIWGGAADRLGRKFAAWGFIVTTFAAFVFLTIPTNMVLLSIVGVIYGLGLSCSAIWGVWFAELYPPHLRSTAVSIFHWGRIVSFFAPLITGRIADALGLPLAMGTGSVVFAAAVVIWLALPETLPAGIRSHRRRGA